MQPRNRYRGFSAVGVKIHPFKRAAAIVSRLLPRPWRFTLFGLPPPANDAGLRADSKIHRVKNGIACQIGTHLDARGNYIPELTLGAGAFIENRLLQKQRCFPKIRRRGATMLSLASEGDLNYYRWLMETLPRMRFVREGNLAYDWLYCRQQHPFHRKSLELLGCDLSRVIASDGNKFVQAAQLVVPPFVDEAESWVIPWLRQQFLPLARQAESAPLAKRIYVTRRKASGRRVANEAELLESLQSLGFMSAALEDYEWLDQVALFRDAEAIIGPHGAGLANLAFCSPGVLVVELMAKTYPFTFYPEICRQNKIEHHLLPCLPTVPEEVHCSDLVVPVDNLLRLLDRL
jgi:hypothetical protein